jgi:calcium-dependent protein kinase
MNVIEILEDDFFYYVISEILEGGELFDRITKVKSFSEKKAAYILKQVLLAINYMHKKNVTHRDLKPENILLESKNLDNLEVKIADFGFSCVFDPHDGLKTVLGSPLYMAPELVKAEGYDSKVDIWSIGVISYMLLSGRSPFPGQDKKQINHMIVNR